MKAILIGSSTGIGAELARLMLKQNVLTALLGRNVEKMNQIAKEFSTPSLIKYMDLCQVEQAGKILQDTIQEMNGVDLVIINSGVGQANYELDWIKEKQVLEVNVIGFTKVAETAFHYFEQKKSGQIAAVSSILGIRGFWHTPAYNASKAYISNYLEALQSKATYLKIPIIISEIIPGPVHTEMTQNKPPVFWTAPVKKAAKQIWQAILSKKRKVYITKRWRLVAWVLYLLPEPIYICLFNRTKK